MNYYIDAQITNMILMTKTFNESCRMAATQNDGKIDKDEEKTLKKIRVATEKFIKELESIKKP